MNINKWSIVLGIIGVFVIIVSIIRWIFLYPDLSQCVLGILVGITSVGAAYSYNLFRNIENDLKDTNHGIDVSINYFNKKIDKLEKEIKGLKK